MIKSVRHTRCLSCGSSNVITIDSRHEHVWRMRRRHCATCLYRWTTYEVPADLVEGMEEFLIQAQRLRDMAASLSKTLEMFGVRLTSTCTTTNPGGEHQTLDVPATNQ